MQYQSGIKLRGAWKGANTGVARMLGASAAQRTRSAKRLRLPAASALAIAVVTLASPPAHAQTVQGSVVATTNTARTLSNYALLTQAQTDPFGVTFPLDVTGGVVLGDGSSLIFKGTGAISGTAKDQRVFTKLPANPDAAKRFFAPLATSAIAAGARARGQNILLRNSGTLSILASASADQSGLDLAKTSIPAGIVGATIESRVEAAAVGLADDGHANSLYNSGRLTTTSDASAKRHNMLITPLAFSSDTQLLSASSSVIGLAGGTATRSIDNATGATITANAAAAAELLDLSVRGVDVVVPQQVAHATALAAGMAGGVGDDLIRNLGIVLATATATVQEIGVSLSATELSPPSFLIPGEDVSTRANAIALGLEGGLGADLVQNNGMVQANALAKHRTTNVSLSDGGISSDAIATLVQFPDLPEEPNKGAIARSIGISGGLLDPSGADRLISNGTLVGQAYADSKTVGVSVAVPINSLLGDPLGPVSTLTGMFGASLANFSSAAGAYVAGIAGGGGGDEIVHNGALTVLGTGLASTTSVSADVLGWLADVGGGSGGGDAVELSLGINVFDTSSGGFARSTGIAGDAGNDSITTGVASTISTVAASEAKATTVSAGLSMGEKQVKASGAVLFARTRAQSEAYGIDGGSGSNTIVNRGAITALADAKARATTVSASLNMAETGLTATGELLDTATEADAYAAAIHSASASDTIDTSGPLTATAKADVGTVGVDVGITVTTEKGVAIAGAVLRANQTASATAVAVDQPLSMAGLPGATIGAGPLSASADASASRTGVGVDITYTAKGVDLSAPFLLVDNNANASASLVTTGAGSDRIVSSDSLAAQSAAKASSTSVGVGIAAFDKGVGVGVSGVMADTQAIAWTNALSLGGGADYARIDGALDGKASAIARSVDAIVGISGGADGVAIGAALASQETNADAFSATLDAGEGDDEITGAGSIAATTFADSGLTGVDVAVSGVLQGVSASAVLARSSTNANAFAKAVDLGAGNDRFYILGGLGSTASAVAGSTGVTVGLSASGTGLGVGAALASLDVNAEADARAAEGGEGNDQISVTGAVQSAATADAHSTAINVGVGLSFEGAAAGATALFGDTDASAFASGLRGGSGTDALEAKGPLLVSSAADADRTDISVALSAAVGVALNFTYVDASTLARSSAVGLAGDDGDDRLFTRATSLVSAASDAHATSVAVSGSLGIGGGASLFETATTAFADAFGQSGGAGQDGLFNTGALTSTAEATAGGPTISVNLVGAGIGDANSFALANAVGLAGGEGDDVVQNSGTILASAAGEARGKLINVVLTGAAMGDVGTAAGALATGIDAGVGNDTIDSIGGVTATAVATAPTTNIAVTLTGAAMPGSASAATTDAVAIRAGDGADVLQIGGSLAANATSAVGGTAVAVTLTGLAQSDASLVATSHAAAIDAGQGYDTADISATMAVSSGSTLTAEGVDVALLGVGMSSVDLAADASGYGYRGDGGGHAVQLAGGGAVQSLATTSVKAIEVSLTGGAIAEPDLRSLATAALIETDEGVDQLTNAGKTLVSADAKSSADAVTVAVIGASNVRTGALAQAQAAGLRSGAGDDALANAAPLEVVARARAEGKSQVVSIVGLAKDGGSSAGGVRALADAQGMDGGAGDDVLYQMAPLTVRADAQVENTGLNVSVIGSADTSDQDLQRARATSVGVFGGDGNDMLDLSGLTIVEAVATGGADNSTVTIAGIGKTKVGSLIEAIATGADGGTGDDALVQRSSITLAATANGGLGSTGSSLLGGNATDLSTKVRAVTLGMIGGGDKDDVKNLGTISATAIATARSLSSNTLVAGALFGNADSLSIAEALGMDGGEGDDSLDNAGLIDLVAVGNGRAASRQVTLAGSASASAASAGISSIVGMAGGDGADELINRGTIRMLGQSFLSAISNTTNIVGKAPAGAALQATGLAIGLGGGEGADHLVNDAAGEISVEQHASLSLSTASMSIVGESASNALANISVDARGLSGDGGNDVVESYGKTQVLGRATITGAGSSYAIVGDASSGGFLTPVATATGLAGDDGNDSLFTRGILSVRGESASNYNSSDFALVGSGGGNLTLGSIANAVGVNGGGGANQLGIEGTADVSATATTVLGSNVKVLIGSASGSTPTGATAAAYGMAGSGLQDSLSLNGALNVSATATANFQRTQFALVGSAGGRNASLARATTYGLAGFAGDNQFLARGTLVLQSNAFASGSGAAGVNLGTTDSASEAAAETSAYAFDGGTGADVYGLGANITVGMEASAVSDNDATTTSIFSDGKSRAQARTGFSGAIVRDSGDSDISFAQNAILRATGDENVRIGFAYANAMSQGRTAGVYTDAMAYADARTAFGLSGFLLGAGVHTLGLDGDLTVSFTAGALARAQAEGNSAISGEGFGNAAAELSGGIATGVSSLDGRATVMLAGAMTVRASPVISAIATATSAGIGAYDPDANATASAKGDGAWAIGVRLGAAADQVLVTGTMDILSAPVAKSNAAGIPAASNASRVDAFATATASANDAEAIGIWAGDGANIIENRGTITVSATPSAIAVATAIGKGGDGDATASAVAQATDATAIGIHTGSDADTIINSGNISVTARPTASAASVALPGTDSIDTGEASQFALRLTTSMGIGISSGAGNDSIVNSGKIVLDNVQSEDLGTRVAIDAGDGNDQVTLSGPAGGDILLGNGDDGFTLQGGEVTGKVYGGAGLDTLQLVGAGNFVDKFDGFESLVKSGAGTYSIGLWNGTGTTRIEAGTLAISGQSRFGSGHALITVIRADGSNGALAYGNGAVLRGTLDVEATRGAYVNGRSWDVITSGATLTNSFDKVTLPTATAMRSFSSALATAQAPSDRYRVSVTVRPSVDFAETPAAKLYAQALDAATPTATGSTAETIATLQSLATARDVSDTLRQLASPAPMMAVASAWTTFDNGLQLMRQRPAMRPAGETPTAGGFLRFQSGAPAAPGRMAAWSATVTGALAPQQAGAAGQILGLASGFDIAREDGAVIGLGLVQQVTMKADGGVEGRSRSMMLAANYRAPISPLAELSISAAAGGSRFRSGSAISGRSSDGVDQHSTTYALSVDLQQAVNGGDNAPSLFTRLDWRRTGGSYATSQRERVAGLVVDHVSSEQAEATFGARWSPSYRLSPGGARISGRFQAGWVHDFGAGDRYRAHLADMRQLALVLPVRTNGRDSFAYDIGADVAPSRGLRLGLSSAGRLSGGAALQERITRLNVQLSF